MLAVARVVLEAATKNAPKKISRIVEIYVVEVPTIREEAEAAQAGEGEPSCSAWIALQMICLERWYGRCTLGEIGRKGARAKFI